MTAIRTFGTIAHLTRFPVKSMRGEDLSEAEVRLSGLAGDRWYAFVQDGNYSSFPWLTGREHSEMIRYRPQVTWQDRTPLVEVTTPAGRVLSITSDELREELEAASGRKLRLHTTSRGNFDSASISLISTTTIRALTEEHGVSPDHRRFRMNLTVDADIPPFGEAELVGQVLRIGTVRLAVTQENVRCQMITLDPESAESTPGVLKSAGALNNACAGVYLAVMSPGKIAVGDALVVENS